MGKKSYTPPAVKTEPREEFFVYIGPTILNVIQSGTIYPGGTRKQMLERVSEALKHNSKIETLIVGASTLVDDRVKVITPGNLLYVNYQKVAQGKNN